MISLSQPIYSMEIPLVESFAKGRSQFVKLLRQENGFLFPTDAILINASHTDAFIQVSIRLNDEKLFTFKTTMHQGELAKCISLVNCASVWEFPIVLSIVDNSMHVSFHSVSHEKDAGFENLLNVLQL